MLRIINLGYKQLHSYSVITRANTVNTSIHFRAIIRGISDSISCGQLRSVLRKTTFTETGLIRCGLRKLSTTKFCVESCSTSQHNLYRCYSTVTYFEGGDFDYVSDSEDCSDLVGAEAHSKSYSKQFVTQTDEWANAIVQRLKKVIDFDNDNILLIQCGTQDSKLTNALLKHNDIKVLCLEYRDEVPQSLRLLLSKRSFKDRIFLRSGNILQLRSLVDYVRRMTGADIEKGSNINIIGTTFPYSLFNYFISVLSYDLGYRNHIYSYGPVTFFLLVPPKELQLFDEEKGNILFRHRSLRSALYKLFFDVKILMKIPKETFRETWPYKHKKDNHIYMIKLQPRSDLYDMCAAEDIPKLIMLLKTLRRKTQAKVISTLEILYSVEPSACHDIGFADDTLVKDLTSEEVVKIHQMLLHLPTYINVEAMLQ